MRKEILTPRQVVRPRTPRRRGLGDAPPNEGETGAYPATANAT